MLFLLFLLAEHEIAVPVDTVGTWLVVGFFVLGGLWTAIQIYDRIVPKAATTEYMTKIEAVASNLVVVTRLDTIDKRVEELDKYAHDRNHDMVDAIHGLAMKMAVMTEVLPKGMEKIGKDVETMGQRLDRMSETMTCPAARSEIKSQIGPR